MKTITFLNIKGGVAKTTTTETVGHILANMFHKRVLLIDADPQGNLTKMYGNLPIMEIVVKALQKQPDPMEGLLTLADLLRDRKQDVKSAIRKTDYEGLDIIPALLSLANAETFMKADISHAQQFNLKRHLEQVQDDYDYCLIDCSPSVNLVNLNALVASDKVYVPMRVDANSVLGMCTAEDIIQDAREFNPSLLYGGCFFTQYDQRKNISDNAKELVEQYRPDNLLPCIIRQSVLIEEMSWLQKPLLEHDPKAKGEYANVTKEYLALTSIITDGECNA